MDGLFGKSSFEYNAAYSNQFDLTSAIDNDGADTFFGMQGVINDNFELNVHTIKQEMLSPSPSTPQRDTSADSSDYLTPYASSTGDRTLILDHNELPPLDLGHQGRSLSMPDVSAEAESLATPGTPRAVSVDGLADVSPHTPRAGVEGLSVAMRDLRMSAVKRAANTPARKSVKFEGLPLYLPREKHHNMETRLDTRINTPILELRTRSVTRFSQAALNLEDAKDDTAEPEQEAVSDICGQPLEPDSNIRSQPFETQSNIRSQPFETQSNIRSQPFQTHSNVRGVAFDCGEDRKRKGSPITEPHSQASKYISMAESLRKFQVETPERFHSKPRTTDVFKHKRVSAMRSTVPHSPALQSKLRSRPSLYPTREQVEEKEAAEMQSYKVKALPMNQKVFKTPQLGKRIEKPPTTIQPFNLTEVKKKELLPTKPTFNFTARPVPRGILNGTTGLKEKQPAPLTDPITPAFVRRRLGTLPKHTSPVVVNNGATNTLGTKEIFHFGVRKSVATPGHRKPTPTKLQKTEVVPFSFEERDKLIQKKKEEKIKKYLEAEQKSREFHANPLPGRSRSSSSNSVNENRQVLPDQMTASHLIADVYAARRLERIKMKEQEEAKELKKMVAFKARPATVVHSRPFVVKKAELPLMEICPFEFNTVRRAQEREDFERQLQEKRELYEECMRLEEEERKEKAMEKLAQMRRQTVHKANPVGKFKQFEIQPSKKELTQPKSPFVHRAAPSQ